MTLSNIKWYCMDSSWWRHQMETFSALLAICAAGNSPVPGEFPAQRPVTRSFDVFFDLGLNKRLSKQSWGCWFETPSRSLWRHRNDYIKHRPKLTKTHHTSPSWVSVLGWDVNILEKNQSCFNGTVLRQEQLICYAAWCEHCLTFRPPCAYWWPSTVK